MRPPRSGEVGYKPTLSVSIVLSSHQVAMARRGPPCWLRLAYHSYGARHGNGACCHGNRLGCHGNIAGSASGDLASITWHVTHVIGLGDLLWLTQKPYISILLNWMLKFASLLFGREIKQLNLGEIDSEGCMLWNDWVRSAWWEWGCLRVRRVLLGVV